MPKHNSVHIIVDEGKLPYRKVASIILDESGRYVVNRSDESYEDDEKKYIEPTMRTLLIEPFFSK